MNGAFDQSVFTNPPLVAQSSAFHRLEYSLIAWFFGNGTPIDSAFLNSLMGTLSTKKLRSKITKKKKDNLCLFEFIERNINPLKNPPNNPKFVNVVPFSYFFFLEE